MPGCAVPNASVTLFVLTMLSVTLLVLTMDNKLLRIVQLAFIQTPSFKIWQQTRRTEHNM